MSWRRLLTRLWMVGSAFWVGYAGWLIGSGTTFPDPNLLVTTTFTLAPPIAVLGLGHAIAWIIRLGRK